MLLERQHVGDGLAWVFFVGQCVHDVQAACRRRKFAEQTLRERPDDDRVDPPLEISRHVGNRLALTERHVGLQRDHLAAELADSDLECRSRAQRRLLEQQCHMTAVQGRGRRRVTAKPPVLLQLRGKAQTSLEVAGIEVEHRQEILPAGECDWHHRVYVR